MIGREEELQMIQHALDGARAGRGRLVIVEGAPGSGRTRLVHEAAAEARRLGFRVICLGGGGEGELALVDSALNDAARGRPMLLVDDTNAGLSGRMTRATAVLSGLPVAALVTTTAAATEGAEGWTRECEYDVTRVRLRALRPGAVMALAVRSGAGLSIAVLERLHVATGGNALLVVETLSAIASGASLAEDEIWPLSERSLVWMRALLDGLSPVGRELLECATVLGPSGAVASIARMTDDELDVSRARSGLAENGLVTIGLGDQWRFVAPLARDLVYVTLSAERRAVLHARAEAALAAIGAPPATLIAHRTLAAAAAGDARRSAHYLFRLVEQHAPPDAPLGPATWPYFVREGEHWAIGFGGLAIRLSHRAGLLYLARLLSRPGVEFAALALGEERRVRKTFDIAAREPTMDAERARVRVTRRVRDGIQRIARAHPELGAHLERTIRTGARCVYVVDAASAPRWEVRWAP